MSPLPPLPPLPPLFFLFFVCPVVRGPWSLLPPCALAIAAPRHTLPMHLHTAHARRAAECGAVFGCDVPWTPLGRRLATATHGTPDTYRNLQHLHGMQNGAATEAASGANAGEAPGKGVAPPKEDMWLVANKLAQEGKVKARVPVSKSFATRIEYTRSSSLEDYTARMHCVRQASAYLLETGQLADMGHVFVQTWEAVLMAFSEKSAAEYVPSYS